MFLRTCLLLLVFGLHYVKTNPVACQQSCASSDYRCTQCQQQVICQCRTVNCNNCGRCCSSCCQPPPIYSCQCQNVNCNNCGGNCCSTCCSGQGLQQVDGGCNNCASCESKGNCQTCCDDKTKGIPPPSSSQPPQSSCDCRNIQCPRPGDPPAFNLECIRRCCPSYLSTFPPPPLPPPQGFIPTTINQPPNPMLIPQLNVSLNIPNFPMPSPPPQLNLPNITFNIHHGDIKLTIPINNTISCGSKGPGGGTVVCPEISQKPTPMSPHPIYCTPQQEGFNTTLKSNFTTPCVPFQPSIPGQAQMPCCSVMHGGGCSVGGMYPFQQVCQQPRPIQYCGSACMQALQCQMVSGGQPCYMPSFPSVQGIGCPNLGCVQQQISSFANTALNPSFQSGQALCIQIAIQPFAYCVPVNGGVASGVPAPIQFSQGNYMLG